MLRRLVGFGVANRALSTPFRTILLAFYPPSTAPKCPSVTPIVLVLTIAEPFNLHRKGASWPWWVVYRIAAFGQFFGYGLVIGTAHGWYTNVGGHEEPRVHEMRLVAEVLHDYGEGFGLGLCAGGAVRACHRIVVIVFFRAIPDTPFAPVRPNPA
jgi:hypothetical protein